MPHQIADWHAGPDVAIVDSRAVAQDILNGGVAPGDGCAVIAALCECNGWPKELLPFSALAHDQDGHDEFGINRGNSVELILAECRIFLGNGSEA